MIFCITGTRTGYWSREMGDWEGDVGDRMG